jgi:hypothetical protein
MTSCIFERVPARQTARLFVYGVFPYLFGYVRGAQCWAVPQAFCSNGQPLQLYCAYAMSLALPGAVCGALAWLYCSRALCAYACWHKCCVNSVARGPGRGGACQAGNMMRVGQDVWQGVGCLGWVLRRLWACVARAGLCHGRGRGVGGVIGLCNAPGAECRARMCTHGCAPGYALCCQNFCRGSGASHHN